ncbi:MAG: hypothetical protein PHE54_04195 [Bacilli bacterium]|nr:hypothetical protein [Bacilli bacterium]
MREAIGNTFVFNLIIIFVIVVSLILVGSLSYTKAFKVKNKIINAIEETKGFTSTTIENIEESLAKIGYRINKTNKACPAVSNTNCESVKISAIDTTAYESDYRYCVYSCTTDKGIYYKVTAFMYFDIPIIEETMEFPISGETRTFYDF